MSMTCPECSGKTQIVDSRLIESQVTRRRHKCLTCGVSFTTRERMEGRSKNMSILTQAEILTLRSLQEKVLSFASDKSDK